MPHFHTNGYGRPTGDPVLAAHLADGREGHSPSRCARGLARRRDHPALKIRRNVVATTHRPLTGGTVGIAGIRIASRIRASTTWSGTSATRARRASWPRRRQRTDHGRGAQRFSDQPESEHSRRERMTAHLLVGYCPVSQLAGANATRWKLAGRIGRAGQGNEKRHPRDRIFANRHLRVPTQTTQATTRHESYHAPIQTRVIAQNRESGSRLLARG